VVVETIEEVTEKILLFGAGGMLGHALRDVFPHAVPLTRRDVDITDPAAVGEIIRRHRPATVINAAAYTDVDGCEDNRDHAFATNGKAPGIIAAACAETGATLVHFSTDYVFDGTRKEYREDDEPNPISVYGQSKLMGETAVRQNTDDYRIIRTSWLYGSHGRNFVDTILTLSKQNPVVKVVSDQRGKPTYAVDLARKVPELISSGPGMYHITNNGVCSWYEFACAFIPNAVPCTTAEFPRKAQRPAYSVLVNTKTAPLRHWKDAVTEYIQKRGTLT
jgi:dTDP-4-dehydrorhamnose reductase